MDMLPAAVHGLFRCTSEVRCPVIAAAVFDVGEVLVNETREYGMWRTGWAYHATRPRLCSEVSSPPAGTIGKHFQVFQLGFDLSAEREARATAGQPETFGVDDLYPDAFPSGGAAGDGAEGRGCRQSDGSSRNDLHGLGRPADWIATSDSWGVEKPSPGFFARAVEESGVPAGQVLYIGDRLDNDVRPALDAGMKVVPLRRGPWGLLLSDSQTEARCMAVLHDLSGLPELVAQRE